MLEHMSRELVASSLGYLSIACWLCAQLPQVIKNATLRSCEGLALPFLMNWMFGDITNLIGCLLTDQLPFQTYLATYFCLIDAALVYQYFHYQSTPPTPSPIIYTAQPSLSLHQSLILSPPSHAELPRTRSASHPAGPYHPPPTASSTSTVRPSRHTDYASTSTTTIHEGLPSSESYVAIYEAALDVARAAERVSFRRSESARRQHLSRQTTRSDRDDPMMESFHSEMSAQTTSTTGDARMAQSTPALGGRGRSMTRNLQLNTEEGDVVMPLATGVQEELIRERRSKSRSISMARGSGGRGGRRAAGVAFMSLGLLAGGGWLGMPGQHSPSTALQGVGRVIPADTDPVPPRGWTPRYPAVFSNPPFESGTTLLYMESGSKEHPDRPHPEPEPEEPFSLQRIIGRISAWACTTLYLTSRLPQIWKNFQRKSVEGLSILLFLFAFCGNLTYVISILLNPAGTADPSLAGHYLLESLPYLLGSGGTLVFDLTIVIQSFMYGSAPPVPPTPHVRRPRLPFKRRPTATLRHYTHPEDGYTERQPLLSGVPTIQSRSPSYSRSRDSLQHNPSRSHDSIHPHHHINYPQPMTATTDRERSLSPGVALRMTSTEAAAGKRRREASTR